MLQQDKPDDYVIETDKTYSVRDLLEEAFRYVNLEYKDNIIVDDKLLRPAEVDLLSGDPSKAKKKLNWVPEVSFSQLIQMMVDSDLETTKINLKRE